MAARAKTDDLLIRRATAEDRPAVIDLCRASLGWKQDDPNEAFFAWKHDENPFGESPTWVAETADGQLAGLRVFLRWRFRTPDGVELRAVRAVDTATHPEHQGKGIFTKLTLGALPGLRDDGADFVFNTPNDKSRPGYLKMGWSEVGRVPIAVRFGSASAVLSARRARTAADMWSRPCSLGVPAIDVFADDDATASLLERCDRPTGIATDRTPEYLKWRYRFDPLRYRALPVGSDLRDGVVVFRLRNRGSAVEAAVCELLMPDRRQLKGLLRRISQESGADHLLVCGGMDLLRSGCIPAPKLGPILTWRPICRMGAPAMRDLSLALGDVELF